MTSPRPPRQRSDLILEILWARAIGIVDEAATALVRTSISSAIRDFHDYACALFDADGELIAQATKSTPGLLGVLPPTVKNFLSVYPSETLRPGDVLITNDPWLATGHLIDITIASPIFYQDRLVGLALCVVHHWDVGGRLATTESSDVFEEGLRIPISKLYNEGVINEDVLSFVRSNVRMPQNVIGDIKAQVAANNVMSRRLRDLLDESGLKDLQYLSAEILGRSEASMRHAIRQIPDGTYCHSRDLDLIDKFDPPIHVSVRVTVDNDEISIDYSGSSPQVDRAINAVKNMTMSYTGFAIKSAINPTIPNNAGSLRPIHLVAPEGSILNAKPPAATWGRTMVVHWLPELIYAALSDAIPEHVIAGSGGTPLSSHVVYGHKRTGRRFLVKLSQQGGLGARATSDGISCLAFPGNVSNIPIEVIETDAPVLVIKKELRCDSGGAGRYRGGFGQEVEVQVCSGNHGPQGDAVQVGLRAARFDSPIPGLNGGLAGSPSELYINGSPVRSGGKQILRSGDTLLFRTAGGGGFGDPFTRDPLLVERDVKNGLVSALAARELYGVVIRDSGRVDRLATERLRRERAGHHADNGEAE